MKNSQRSSLSLDNLESRPSDAGRPALLSGRPASDGEGIILKFNTFISALNRICAIVAGLMIFVVGIFSTYEGLARGLFSSPTIWSSDVTRYMMIWAIFLGTASAFLGKTHISVDFVRDLIGRRWGPGLQRFLAILGYFFSLVYVLVLAWCSLDLFGEAYREGKLSYGTIQIPVTYLYLAMVVGSVLMVMTLLPIIASLIRKKDDYL